MVQKKKERVTCVHILPLAYQLSLFMVSCLAENILLELSALMNSSMIEESLSKEEKVCIKKNLILLMEASSNADESLPLQLSNVKDMLQNYAVGTEQRKSTPVGVIPADQLGPLQIINKKSIIKKAACKINKTEVNDSEKKVNIDSVNYYCNGECHYFIFNLVI